jgi:hypothetical protein
MNVLGLLLLGVVTGNIILIYIGIIPIIFTLTAIYLKVPSEVEVDLVDEVSEVYINDDVTLRRKLKVVEGLGPIIVYEPIPREFKILNGNNIHLLWKGREPLTHMIDTEIQCTKRGIYNFRSLTIRGMHPFELKSQIEKLHMLDQSLVVKPKPIRVKRVRQRRQYTLFPIPSESKIKIGVPTTDFREIRQYNYGDSYKKINWKATARLNTQIFNKPSVNEYEREGRRVTWILLDTAPRLELGNNIRNSLECAIQAVTSITEFYIQRQCMVGYAEFATTQRKMKMDAWFQAPQNAVEETKTKTLQPYQQVIFPDAGPIQLHKIQRALLKTKINHKGPDLKETLHSCRGHIVGTNPLFIVITTIDEQSLPNLKESLKEIIKYSLRLGDRKTPILLINVSGYSMASNTDPQTLASKVLRFDEKELLGGIGGPGLITLNWDPDRENIIQAMMSTVRTH